MPAGAAKTWMVLQRRGLPATVYTLPIPCDAVDFAWSTTMYPGTYDATVFGTGVTDLPGISPAAPFEVGAEVAGHVVDVTAVDVTGAVTLDGHVPRDLPDCVGANEIKATVSLEDLDRPGYVQKAFISCDTSGYSFHGPVYRGRFRVRVEGGGDTVTDLPSAAAIVSPELQLSAGPAHLALDVQTVAVSGAITKRGLAPVVFTACQDNDQVNAATVRFVDATQGYEIWLHVPCTTPDFTWHGVVPPGTYDVSVSSSTMDGTNLPFEPFRARHGLTVTDDTDVGVLDVGTIDVFGRVTENGAVPADGHGCDGQPTHEKAAVVFAEVDGPAHFELPVACSSSTSFWNGTIFPGTYNVSVRGGSLCLGAPCSDLPSDVPFVVDGAMPFTTDTGSLFLDVKTVEIGGRITLNGGPAPVRCPTRGPKATVDLLDRDQGYSFHVPVDCPSPGHRFTGKVYPGVYEVRAGGNAHFHQLGGLPQQPYLVAERLAIP